MKKYLIIALSTIAILLAIYVFIQFVPSGDLKTTETESYSTEIIKLEHQIFAKNDRGIGECAVPLWMVINYLFAVDEQHNIYILDIYKNRIIHLTSNGKLLKEIFLKNINYEDFSCDGDGCPLIQVAPQGDLFYLKSGDLQHIILCNYKGIPIKKKASPGCLDRVCEEKFKGTLKTSTDEIWDKNMNSGYYDLKSNLYSLNGKDKLVLNKNSLDGNKIWNGNIAGYKKAISILDIDSIGNIYILMDNPDGIVKINKDGLIVAKITLPQNQNGTFKVLCDGTIYFFPSNVEIVKNKAQKAKDEYSIYKFEKKD